MSIWLATTKQHFASSGIALPPFRETPTVESIQEAAKELGLPLMLKSRRGGYDGKGNAVVQSLEEIPAALEKLGIVGDEQKKETMDLYAEGWIDFDCEVAVMVVKSAGAGSATASYPAVQAIQQDSICRVVLAPAPHLTNDMDRKCQEMARRAVDSLGSGAAGMFGVELFVQPDGGVLLNEIAPRPHNTGHYTQNACAVNQFENHLRGITGLPLGTTTMIVEAAASKSVVSSNTVLCFLVFGCGDSFALMLVFTFLEQWSMCWELNREPWKTRSRARTRPCPSLVPLCIGTARRVAARDEKWVTLT